MALLLLVSVGGGFPLVAKKFASPDQYRGEDYKPALISNWRALVTHINRFMPSYEQGTTDLNVPGDLTVEGNIGVSGEVASQPTVTGSRGGNAALASLLTALENMGLIIDNTS